jgi:exonuclease VII large subunit
MKPRTEREREVMRLHASLPAITKAQREWAIDHCFDTVGYICKGIVWCTKCGGQFEKKTSDLSVSLKVEDKAVCPHCGRKLELKVSRKRKIKDTAYMTVLTTQGRWQVFRHYLVERAMYRVSGNLDGCDKPSIYVWEVVQNWIDDKGSELVVARPRKPIMGYYDSWDVSKKMELRKRWSGYTLDPYNINVYTEYPRKKVLEIFKRNGYKGKNPTGMSTMDMFKLIVCQNMAETLLKAEQYGLLELMKNRLIAAENQNIARNTQRYIALTAKLDAISPLKVLTRGYSMAQNDRGEVIRSVSQVELGERIGISFSDGKVFATVMDKKENG